jgi:hydrogenase expression/formation protein HypD
MLRVPGSRGDLLAVRAEGADVRFVYSPIDALEIARQNPDKEVVFFGIGFETTAPANAFAVFQAHSTGLKNFSMLVSQVLVPPAIESLLEAPGNRVQGFLGPGHVCSVMGFRDYEELAGRYRTPIVVTGFEPVDLLEGVLRCVEQLEQGLSLAENQYARSVHADGNAAARAMVERVFETVDRKWRGLGLIPRSGYGIRREYRDHDAEHRFEVRAITTSESKRCISGLVLQGRKKPCDCPAFGVDCKPESPLGATMVSSEGACRAYFAHGRHRELSDAV